MVTTVITVTTVVTITTVTTVSTIISGSLNTLFVKYIFSAEFELISLWQNVECTLFYRVTTIFSLSDCGLSSVWQIEDYLLFLPCLLDSFTEQYFPTVGKVIKQTLSTIDQG